MIQICMTLQNDCDRYDNVEWFVCEVATTKYKIEKVWRASHDYYISVYARTYMPI